MKALLYTTDTYYNAIELTASLFSNGSRSLDAPKIVFTPEKFTLMLETKISAKIGGYLNTRVFSFSKFLHYFGEPCKVLSKEASVMVIRKILGERSLSCFKAYQTGIAQNVYDSIALLKSAKVSLEEIDRALINTEGILNSKLLDLKELYTGYEDFLKTGYVDQSDLLSQIPDILDKFNNFDGKGLTQTEVYLVGFDSWTKQARIIVDKLIKKAKSVTAILVGGDNEGVYTNETPNAFISICKDNGLMVKPIVANNPISGESIGILEGLYNEKSFKVKPKQDNNIIKSKIKLLETKSLKEEVEYIASSVKRNVLNGARYRDHGVAISDTTKYYDIIEKVFTEYEVPYYLDVKKKFSSHPLAGLVISYIEMLRKNFSKETVIDFVKNPLFCMDKYLSDKFENYVLKYNVKYNKFFEPFKDIAGTNVELLRQKLVSLKASAISTTAGEYVDTLYAFLKKIDVEGVLTALADELDLYDKQEAEYTRQAYGVLTALLDSVKEIIPSSKMDLREFKMVLGAGFNASEISILPQRNDAVYIGGYRDVGSTIRKHLYCIGLTGDVPEVKQDIAVLSDREISLLSDIKIIIEPKVKAVNSREREIFATALTAFTDTLTLSYSIESREGKGQSPSDAINYLKKIFSLNKITPSTHYNLLNANLADKYLTFAQAEKQFALDYGLYKDGVIKDKTLISSYYYATNDLFTDGVCDKPLTNEILSFDTEADFKLDDDNNFIIKNKVSVSTLESFYSCPFKCFLDKGVRVEKRDTGVIESDKTGDFIHKVLEEYAKKFKEGKITDLASSDFICDEIFVEVSANEDYSRFNEELSNENVFLRLKNELKRITRGLYYQLTNTDFKIVGTEVEFDNKEHLQFKAIPLNTKKGKVYVKGYVDRLDATENYYRIIDYKSGSAKLEDSELFMGKKLQLYLYLNAFKGEKLPIGSYYYRFSDDYKSEQEEFQLDGKTVGDKNVLKASDNNLLMGGKSKIINANIKLDKGEIPDKRTKYLVGQEDINVRMEYAKILSEKGVDLIKEGYIKATPYCDYKSVCDYCKYGAICGYEENIKGVKRNAALGLNDLVIKTAVENHKKKVTVDGNIQNTDPVNVDNISKGGETID